MDTPRAATESDIASMIEIWSQVIRTNPSFAVSSEEAVDKFHTNFRSARPPFSFWVVASPSVLAWSSLLPAFSHPLKQSTDAEVSLYVARGHCGNGIGSRLMKFTLEKAHTAGIERVWGFSRRQNNASIRMCEKAGMSICGESREKVILLSEKSAE